MRWAARSPDQPKPTAPAPRCFQWTSAWSLDGALQPGTDGCTDVDLGFTSAGLLATLRPIALPDGSGATGSAVSTIFSVDDDLAVLTYPGRWKQVCRAHGSGRPATHEAETRSPASHAGDLLHSL